MQYEPSALGRAHLQACGDPLGGRCRLSSEAGSDGQLAPAIQQKREWEKMEELEWRSVSEQDKRWPFTPFLWYQAGSRVVPDCPQTTTGVLLGVQDSAFGVSGQGHIREAI